MSQCVPNWELDDATNSARLPLPVEPNAKSTAPAPEETMLDYEVAELTWENGQLAMHGLGPPRTTTSRPPPKFAWEKPRASGTLESIVDQATCVPADKAMEEIVPWFEGHQRADASLPMDALVPCSHRPEQEHPNRVPGHLRGGDFSGIGSWVGSCSGVAGKGKNAEAAAAETAARKRARSSQNQSVSGSETLGRESQHLTVDTSTGSHENTSSRKPMDSRTQTMSIDEHDSVSHSRPQEIGSEDERKGKAGRSSVSSKRSRAAAIHNQSERKRRDRINQRMKTLQKLVPNSSKTDKASMLDEVIDYLKQLQAQVQMMAKMSSIPQMMMPVAMQQQLQLQMSMMAQMGMSMGMGMGVMDMHSMNRPATATAVAPMIHPAAAAAFLPMAASWDASADRLQAAAGILPDPFATFLACQAQQQPINLEAYNRMAALYQQLHQSTAPTSKT